MLLNILKETEANILGIDVIAKKGIEIDFNQQQCIFLELNSRPNLKMHNYPRFGEKEDLAAFYYKLNQLDIQDTKIF